MYRLYSDNLITKGYTRDLLVDFARSQIRLIPKEITEFIEALECGQETFSDADQALIAELLEKEIIFNVSPGEEALFPKLDLAWDYPAKVSNAAIEVTSGNLENLRTVFDELESLNCFYYSIILNDSFSGSELDVLYECLCTSSILSFELTINYYKSKELNAFLFSCLKLTRLTKQVTIFNCDDEDFKSEFKKNISLRFSTSVLNSCGCIRKENFNCNLNKHTESLQYNTCLNRKIGIDGTGNIKNCPSMKQSFGNIKVNSIESILETNEFKKYWNIKKDEVHICRDCEFRNVCTDCRVFIENPEDAYSKPLKCGYNPYTNIWEEWSENPAKHKAMEFYGLDRP